MKTSATFPHDSSKIPRHLPRTRFPDEWSYVVTLLPIRIHWWLGRPVGRTTSTTGGGAGDHAAAAARDRPTAVVGDAGIVGGRAGPGGRSLLSTRTSAQVLATPCSLRASHRYSASSSTVTESMIRRQTPSMYSSRMWALDASVLPSCANEQPNDHVTGHPHHRCKKNVPETTRSLRYRRLLCLRQHATKPKTAFRGIFDPNRDFDPWPLDTKKLYLAK